MDRRSFAKKAGCSAAAVWSFLAGSGGAAGKPDPSMQEEVFNSFFDGEEVWQTFDFVPGRDHFELTSDGDRRSVIHLHKIGPLLDNPRRPRTYALIRGKTWTEAEVTLWFRYRESLGVPDIVIPFCYRDPLNWYYVHLSSRSDNVHNVIMKIAGPDNRYTIHNRRTRAPLQDKKYYAARLRFNTDTGKIAVWMSDDDMGTPVLEGEDKDMEGGLLGFGSFDTMAYYDRLHVKGTSHN